MSTYLTMKGLRNRGVDAELIMFPLSPGGKLGGGRACALHASLNHP